MRTEIRHLSASRRVGFSKSAQKPTTIVSVTQEPSLRYGQLGIIASTNTQSSHAYILTCYSFLDDVEREASRGRELRLPHVGVQITNLPVPAEHHDTRS